MAGQEVLAKYLTDSIRSVEEVLRKNPAALGPTTGASSSGRGVSASGQRGAAARRTSSDILIATGHSSGPAKQQAYDHRQARPAPHPTAASSAFIPTRPAMSLAGLHKSLSPHAPYRAGPSAAPAAKASSLANNIRAYQQQHPTHGHSSSRSSGGAGPSGSGRHVAEHPAAAAAAAAGGPAGSAPSPSPAAPQPSPSGQGLAAALAAASAEGRGGLGGGVKPASRAGSVAGSHASWWKQGRGGSEASYPMTAITDRNMGSVTGSELEAWASKMASIEEELKQETMKRRAFEEELAAVQAMTAKLKTMQGKGSSKR